MELFVTQDFVANHSQGRTLLRKGEILHVPDHEGPALLEQFPQFVRAVPKPRAASSRAIGCEPAMKPDGRPLSPIFWESGDGSILGPAVPEIFTRDGGIFGIVATFEGVTRWINTNRLRSRKAFESQSYPRPLSW